MDGNDDLEQYSRIPTIEDLVALCRNLNAHEVKYVVIGGLAIIHLGISGLLEILIFSLRIRSKILKGSEKPSLTCLMEKPIKLRIRTCLAIGWFESLEKSPWI